MSIVLSQASYGKSEVRLVKVSRRSDGHDLHDLTVDVELEGDFTAAYVAGDNAGLLATDTMRNTVYALAKDRLIDDIERFGLHLVEHFLAAAPEVTRARVHLVEHPWARLEIDGRPHEHAFHGKRCRQSAPPTCGDGGKRGLVHRKAGSDELLVPKTTGSAGRGSLPPYTTLPETLHSDLGWMGHHRRWSAPRSAILVLPRAAWRRCAGR